MSSGAPVGGIQRGKRVESPPPSTPAPTLLRSSPSRMAPPEATETFVAPRASHANTGDVRDIIATSSPVHTAQRRPTSPTHSINTVRSHKSQASAVSKAANYELEKELLELELQEIRIKKAFLKKRLQSQGSAAGSERHSVADNHDDRVKDWVDKSIEHGDKLPEENRPPLEATWGEDKEAGIEGPRRKGVDRLAEVLEKMVYARPPPRQTSELPAFTGATSEWLPFKAAMEDSSRLYKFSPTENLLRLRNCLKGEARETVLSQLFTATHPNVVMRTLEMKFGRPEVIIDKAIEDLKKLPKICESSSELNDLAIRLQNIVYTIRSIDQRGYLHNPMLVQEVIGKLSPHLISKWAEHAAMHEQRIAEETALVVLSEYLIEEANRVMRYARTSKGKDAGIAKKGIAVKRTFAKEKVYAANQEEVTTICFKCNSEKHYTSECPKLKEMNTNARWQWAKEQRMCYRCMKRKHNRNYCKAKACGVNGCTYAHHSLLHKERIPAAPETSGSQDSKTDVAVMSVTSKSPATVLLKICKVVLSGPRGEIVTHALLDEGSTVTLVEEDLAKRIASGGTSKPLNIKGINQNKKINSRAIQLNIKGNQEKESYKICARTIKGLELHRQHVPSDLTKYTHLRGIRERLCYEEAKPQILIGADNWHLIVSRQLRSGRRNEPAASWTKLGWVLHGTVPHKMVMENSESVLHIFTSPEDLRLDKMIETHFEVDSLGITNKIRIGERDQRATKIFEATAKRCDGYFEVGLPWKSDNITLPDNYQHALKRLRTLESKMKNPDFKLEYDAQVLNLLKKGYAVKCDGSEDASLRKWFLPHFAVVNHNKPGRVRMVFDAAAKAQGVCLNDFLLEGPDLLTSLTGILFGFREKPIAVTADIQEMFLRVKIRKEDQPAQMFLWRNNPEDPPQRMKMTSMIFGASSSPYLAHSVRNRNAEDYEREYPTAATAIKNKHYMDDYLDSFHSPEEAIKVTQDVMFIHEKAGFNLRGWNSNSSEVLSYISEEKRSKNVDVELTSKLDQPERTLGLRWQPRSDTLSFNTEIKRVPEEIRLGQRVCTKRQALSAVMSIYDPLGLVSHYTIVGKIILQRLWQRKIEWDEELPIEEAKEFANWIAKLSEVSALRLHRCYSRNNTCTTELELHVFNDASEQAYASAAYWRIKHEDGSVEVVLVMAKAKVAPLKLQTIPRLELQAALIGVRMASTILKEHSWRPRRVVYWTDSRTVLHWIRNDTKKYSPFVAHRLAEISELSQKEDWRWVPTEHNVADDATRSHTTTVSNVDRWFTGPSFLSRPEEEWPTCEDVEGEGDRETVLLIASVGQPTDRNNALPDITRFSSYNRLIRSTALVYLFIDKLRSKNKTSTLEISHIERARHEWVVRAQHDSFIEDIRRLRNEQRLQRHSRLAKLDPVLEDNVVRANGRIGMAPVSDQQKWPIILDGRHPFTKLLIKKHHVEAGHANNERVVNDLRQKYLILHLRPTVRKTARECQYCKVYKAAPRKLTQGDLPKARIDPGHRAFSYCGVDYFGPMNVTIGRRREKRWGALFTCLTTRAVHLELVPTLSTDSAIMALRRMAARRGWPRVIYSDNATNFRGADVELKKAYEVWQPALKDFGLQRGTDWRFIPPGAPHMGGSWERLVRSVKTALRVTLKEKAPREELLHTLLTEAEYSVNARPLTHVSVDPTDMEAITPNHFLLGSSTGLPITGACQEADRNTWKKAQALADQFWQRWIKEYLPTLVPRGQAPTTTPQLRVGDLVVVVDGDLPRNVWPRGIVTQTYQGPDGGVRSADITTKGGTFRRPATKLAVLKLEEATRDLRRGETVADG